LCWSLSPSIITREAWAIQKKKVGHMKVQEKKEEEKNYIYSHVDKKIYKGRRSYKRSFHPPFTIHYIHTCAHLDLIVWLVFLLGSGF
jgi:2'-5' RNA ligase